MASVDGCFEGSCALKNRGSVAVVIYCIAPHVDDKRRSKWARALRYAAASKPSDERMFWSTSVKAGLGPFACPVGAYTISAEPWRPPWGRNACSLLRPQPSSIPLGAFALPSFG